MALRRCGVEHDGEVAAAVRRRGTGGCRPRCRCRRRRPARPRRCPAPAGRRRSGPARAPPACTGRTTRRRSSAPPTSPGGSTRSNGPPPSVGAGDGRRRLAEQRGVGRVAAAASRHGEHHDQEARPGRPRRRRPRAGPAGAGAARRPSGLRQLAGRRVVSHRVVDRPGGGVAHRQDAAATSASACVGRRPGDRRRDRVGRAAPAPAGERGQQRCRRP